MACLRFQTLLLLAILYLTGLVSCQSNQFFPENQQGFLDGGCDLQIIRGADYDNQMEASCPDQVCGHMVQTALSLDECLMNDNGNLYWNDTAYYSQSCSDCHIAGDRYMHCLCKSDDQAGEEYMSMIDLNQGVLYNYYGYLSCFGKIDTNRGQHNWPCKGPNWKPWSKENMDVKLGIQPNATEPILVPARPKKTLVPQVQLIGAAANATAGVNGSVSTVTVTPTP